tara:strand:- start:1122 stop:1355 length:234 start_codon:yes stop_codon:yes gene_type:complete
MIKLILWALIFYYVIRVLFRFLFPFFIKYFIKNMLNKKTHSHSQYKEKKTGDTVLKYKKNKNIDPGGDYVDYEEIDK